MVEIGRGGFGVVYRAVEAELGRTVAVKVLPPLRGDDAQRRFERERLALGSLSGHPHIVNVHRSGRTDDDEPFLVMEFCQQGSMADRLEATGPIPWPRATTLAIQIAGGLETAHRAGIVHRDIKPANILLSNLGEPKLADFGIARMHGGHETRSGTITASLAHAAPEILGAERPDARSDVYGLASTLYELLTGAPAFVRPEDESFIQIMARITSEPPPAMDGRLVPAPVASVVAAAMAKDPSGRTPTAGAFGAALADGQGRLGMTPTAMLVDGRAPQASAGGDSTRVIAPPSAPAGTASPSPFSEPPSSWPPPSTAPVDDPGATDAGGDRSGRARPMVVAGAVAAAVVAVAAAVGLLAAGGSGDDDAASPAAVEELDAATDEPTDDDGGSQEPEDPEGPEATDDPAVTDGPVVADEPLTIGTLLPATGDLASLAVAPAAAIELAIGDINAAGGVLGRDVELVVGDSGSVDEAMILSETRRFLGGGVDVVVGPMTTGGSRVVLGEVDDGALVFVSPSATSTDLTDLDTDGIYFRTAATDVNTAYVTGQIVSDAGFDRLALLHIDEPYGTTLADNIGFRYAQLGGVVTLDLAYDPTGSLDEVVEQAADAGAEAIVIVGFDETATLLAGLQELGVGPNADGTPIFGVDANAVLFAEPSVLDGYRSVLPQIDLAPLSPFTTRLDGLGVADFRFAPESYDAVVIAALAAESSGATSGPDLAAAMVEVTRDGERCFDFAECQRLLARGRDIDYDGLAGPHEFTDEGDPRVASFAVLTYSGGESPDPTLREYVFSR